MEITELLLLVIVIVYGISILFLIINYNTFRNIYTQKVLFLNDELRKCKDITKYSISSFKRFRTDIEFEDLYPPNIVSKNLQNANYKALVESFDNYLTTRDRRIKRLSAVFGILFAATGIVAIFS